MGLSHGRLSLPRGRPRGSVSTSRARLQQHSRIVCSISSAIEKKTKKETDQSYLWTGRKGKGRRRREVDRKDTWSVFNERTWLVLYERHQAVVRTIDGDPANNGTTTKATRSETRRARWSATPMCPWTTAKPSARLHGLGVRRKMGRCLTGVQAGTFCSFTIFIVVGLPTDAASRLPESLLTPASVCSVPPCPPALTG